MGRTRFRFGNGEMPHFLTATTVEWLPAFIEPNAANIIVQALRFAREQRGMRLFAYVIMENHLHLVAQAENLPDLLRRFKSYTARRAIDDMKKTNHPALAQMQFAKKTHKQESEHQFWQEGHRPRMLGSAEEMRQAIEYVHMNPVKRGYVDLPEHWRYSSARDYLGRPGLVGIDEWS